MSCDYCNLEYSTSACKNHFEAREVDRLLTGEIVYEFYYKKYAISPRENGQRYITQESRSYVVLWELLQEPDPITNMMYKKIMEIKHDYFKINKDNVIDLINKMNRLRAFM